MRMSLKVPRGHRQPGERVRHGTPGRGEVWSDTDIRPYTLRCSWLNGKRADLAELLPTNRMSMAPALVRCHRMRQPHWPRFRQPQHVPAAPSAWA